MVMKITMKLERTSQFQTLVRRLGSLGMVAAAARGLNEHAGATPTVDWPRDVLHRVPKASIAGVTRIASVQPG
jgi:hypothetical protein